MADPFITVAVEGGIATLTFNRPDVRNAIGTAQDCADIEQALRTVEDDESVSCIILTGAGKGFCAGGNLRGLQDTDGIGRRGQPADTRANYRRGVHRVVRALYDCELPMIAAINGAAIGLGMDIACLCDLRIAADNARFASSFIKLGLIPGDGGAWILSRTIGNAAAAEMILTGDAIDATRAKELGLVSRLVQADQLAAEARELAERIVANPAKTLRLSKRLLREAQHQRFSDVLELSAAYQALAHETEDHSEALAALIEKRAPQLTGR